MIISEKMFPARIESKHRRRELLVLLCVSIVAVFTLLCYETWSNYKKALIEAETKTRGFATVFDTRLDGSLRRLSANLQILAGTLPKAILSKDAVLIYAGEINASLDAYRLDFPELKSVTIFDVDGNFLYSTDKNAAAVNILDRDHFRMTRDSRQSGLVFSDVLIARSDGQSSLFAGRALKDEQGQFCGVIVAGLDLSYIQKLMQSLDLGPKGSMAIYRSDNFTPVLRWPIAEGATTNRPLPINSPTRAIINAEQQTATTQLTSAADGLTRIYSYHRLEHFPFFISVGVARDDALASWRINTWEVGLASLFLAGLLITMAVRMVQAMDLAQTASLAKSQFLSNMSHEIRTPMNAILGMLGLLRKTELTARQADYAAKSEGAAKSLLGLLNDILDFSKIEAGKMTLDPRPFRMDHLLRDLSVIVSANNGEKNVEVLFDIDPALPLYLVGDAMRLQQVLTNLSGNAIKFTAEGEVVISIKVIQREESAVTLEIAVSDTGIGIAPENQARIFSGFTQAEASTTRRFGGTGLGVAISQRMVALMGGELRLDSALGKGSRFHFCITLSVAEETGDNGTPVVPPSVMRQAMIVDDNVIACALLKKMGESLGWVIDIATSGEQALDILKTRNAAGISYQAVFVDCQMQGLDGWETSRRIRKLGLNGSAPIIIMVTAYGLEMLAQRSQADQVLLDGFLVKPVTASMLFDAVVDARSDHGQAHPSRLGAASGGKRLAGMRLLVAEDNLNNQQVAQELLEAEGAIVRIAHNGQEAVDAVVAADPQFDAVLMDLQMPVMDGFTATSFIRQDLCLQIPIVAMTANVMTSDRDACLAAGMNDHIGKPFDLEHLIGVLCQQTGRQVVAERLMAVAEQKLPAAVSSAAVAASVSISDALSRLGGNLGLYRRMLSLFAKDMAVIPTQLMTLVKKSEWDSASRLLHTLKGQAGTLGMMALSAEAARGEKQFAGSLASSEADRLVAQISRAIEEAKPGYAALLQALQAVEAPMAVPPMSIELDTDAVLTHLRALKQHLQNADMAATDVMADIQRQYGGTLGDQLQSMDEAINALDFEHALRLCSALLNEIMEGQLA